MFQHYSDNTMLHFCRILLQHCGEKVSLFLIIALGLWKPLSLLAVIALSVAGQKIVRALTVR
jgi:hypothetical protein